MYNVLQESYYNYLKAAAKENDFKKFSDIAKLRNNSVGCILQLASICGKLKEVRGY